MRNPSSEVPNLGYPAKGPNQGWMGVTPHLTRNSAVESNSPRRLVESFVSPPGTQIIMPCLARVSRTRYAFCRKFRRSEFLIETHRLFGPERSLRNCHPLECPQMQSPPQHRPIQSS